MARRRFSSKGGMFTVSFDIPDVNKFMNTEVARRRAEKTGKIYEKKIKANLEATVATWDHVVIFSGSTKWKNGTLVTEVSTADEAYFYVNRGTSVRHAVMTRDFVAKTAPKRISSEAGRGGVAFVSRSLHLPGIDAREFTKTIGEPLSKEYRRDMIKAIRQGLKGRL